MKITIEHYDKKFVYEALDEITLSELLRDMEGLIKLMGYCFDGELDIVEQEN